MSRDPESLGGFNPKHISSGIYGMNRRNIFDDGAWKEVAFLVGAFLIIGVVVWIIVRNASDEMVTRRLGMTPTPTPVNLGWKELAIEGPQVLYSDPRFGKALEDLLDRGSQRFVSSVF